MPALILASTSRYRRELLERLGLPFTCLAPNVDETSRPGEPPEQLVARLAEAKARAVAAGVGDALVIGSDQVAALDGDVLGKPGSVAGAIDQLTRSAGRTVTFHTGLCLVNAATGHAQVEVVPFRVVFRPLDAARIARYVEKEQPLDCAGGFKSERLGITLFERLEGDDPSALIGLPLIRLVRMLENAGLELP